jgi:hypothetical protein
MIIGQLATLRSIMSATAQTIPNGRLKWRVKTILFCLVLKAARSTMVKTELKNLVLVAFLIDWKKGTQSRSLFRFHFSLLLSVVSSDMYHPRWSIICMKELFCLIVELSNIYS